MTTYKWSVTAIDCYPQAQGQKDVAFNVHWKLTDPTIVSPMAHIYAVHGSQVLTYTAGAPFVEYVNLTEEQVIGWVQTAIGAEQVLAMQAKLDANIAPQENPSVIQPLLPWVK